MSPFAAFLAAAGLVDLFVWLFLLGQTRKDPVKSAFHLLVVSTVLWYGADLLVYHALERQLFFGKYIYLARLSSLVWISSGLVFLNFVYALIERQRGRDPLFIGATVCTVLAAIVSCSTEWARDPEYGPWGVSLRTSELLIGLAFVPALIGACGIGLLWERQRATAEQGKRRLLRHFAAGGLLLAGVFGCFKLVLPLLLDWTQGNQLADTALAVFCVASYWIISKPNYLGMSLERSAPQLLKDFPAGIVLTDASCGVRYINPAAMKLIKKQGPVGLGVSLEELVPVPQSEKGTCGGEFSVKDDQGETFLRADVSQLKSDDRLFGGIVLFQDITKHKREESRLQQSRNELRQQVLNYERALRQAKKIEALSSLSAGIAHDFNNLLSVILGFAGAAREEVQGDTMVADDIDEIILASRRAQNIVDQILTFSETRKGKLRIVAAHELVEDVLSVCKSYLPSEVQVVPDVKVPHLAMNVDPSKIKQALLNLVLNGYQAMEGRAGTIALIVEEVFVTNRFSKEHPPLNSGSHVKIEVCDSGMGMSQEVVSQIFDPLYTTQETASGTGLGLPTALRICNEYSGTLTVESEVGQGTTVGVYLPRIELPASSIPSLPVMKRVGNERVLIVDDEEQFVRVGRRILEPLGYDVTVHTGSVTAWNAFWSNPDAFDLVILDHSMPQINGSELANEISYIRPDLPIILISGDTKAQVMASKEHIVFTEFLSKPIPSEVLADTVRRLLDNKES